MYTKVVYLFFDIGGTTMRLAASESGTSLNQIKRQPTPQEPLEAVKSLAALAREIAGEKITAVVGGIAGVLNESGSALIFSPNLPKWVGFPLQDHLKELWGTSIRITNDAALSGLGEAVVGAGQGHRIVAYVTIGTGVGGTRIIDGHIDQATSNFEPGHQIIDAGQSLCPDCPAPGTLENYVSGTSLKQRFGVIPAEITDPAVWEQVAQFLAYGLNNVIVHWSPDAIVLGGGVMEAGRLTLEPIQKHLQQVAKPGWALPRLLKATLGDTAGLEGARLLIKEP